MRQAVLSSFRLAVIKSKELLEFSRTLRIYILIAKVTEVLHTAVVVGVAVVKVGTNAVIVTELIILVAYQYCYG